VLGVEKGASPDEGAVMDIKSFEFVKELI